MCDNGCWLFLKTLVGFAFYIADLVTDVLQAAEYHRNGDIAWFGLTLGFALGPQIIANIVLMILEGYKWYHLYMIPLGVPVKYLQVLCSFSDCCEDGPEDIWKARKTERQDTREPVARVSNHLLPLARLVGTILESLPELCLQIYILLQDSSLEIKPLKVVTMVASFLASLYSIIEWEAHFPMVKAWLGGIIVLSLWKIIDLLARIFAFCLFASIHTHTSQTALATPQSLTNDDDDRYTTTLTTPQSMTNGDDDRYTYWVFAVVGLHWLIMAVVESVFYYYRENKALLKSNANVIANKKKYVQIIFNTFVVAPVDVFTWVTFGSRLQCKVQPIFNNVLMLVANIVMILLWSCAKDNGPWYVVPLVVGGSAVSVLLQLFHWVCYESCCPCGPIEDSDITSSS
ncbi:uncharacterized protein LOC118419331 [Branchiostoma floridae]|uniref:XK-related protein n=1 Tax=Branchiostoma floridae TaxID=7739 RepID=A0A9J7MWQ6_BRAFL|nr:uncharacterized protein LOC118419331 [Branchiostoma floridae]